MKIPLFPLDLVLLPGAALPLHIFEDRYREMVAECVAERLAFGVVRARREGLAVIGCTANILTVLNEYPDGRSDILCQGAERFEIELLDDTRSFLRADVNFFADIKPPGGGQLDSTRAQREECAAMHFELLQLARADSDAGAEAGFPQLDLDGCVSFQLAAAIPSDLGFKQELLGLRSDAQRSRRLLEFYAAVLPKLRRGASAAKAVSGSGFVM